MRLTFITSVTSIPSSSSAGTWAASTFGCHVVPPAVDADVAVCVDSQPLLIVPVKLTPVTHKSCRSGWGSLCCLPRVPPPTTLPIAWLPQWVNLVLLKIKTNLFFIHSSCNHHDFAKRRKFIIFFFSWRTRQFIILLLTWVSRWVFTPSRAAGVMIWDEIANRTRRTQRVIPMKWRVASTKTKFRRLCKPQISHSALSEKCSDRRTSDLVYSKGIMTFGVISVLLYLSNYSCLHGIHR